MCTALLSIRKKNSDENAVLHVLKKLNLNFVCGDIKFPARFVGCNNFTNIVLKSIFKKKYEHVN